MVSILYLSFLVAWISILLLKASVLRGADRVAFEPREHNSEARNQLNDFIRERECIESISDITLKYQALMEWNERFNLFLAEGIAARKSDSSQHNVVDLLHYTKKH
uniref:Uncharacterized protein n=1 Tax=Pseudoalteromonas rubra TaxID=43658 RepID=A0A0F4Q8P9_9GAMM|nr:hypothetical protein TW77_23730 [Pseudoalteromonas rubra]